MTGTMIFHRFVRLKASLNLLVIAEIEFNEHQPTARIVNKMS